MKNLLFLIIKSIPVIGTLYLLIESLLSDEVKSSTALVIKETPKNWSLSEGSSLDLYVLADSMYRKAGGRKPSFEYVLSSNSFGDRLRITPIGEHVGHFDYKEISGYELPGVLAKVMTSGKSVHVKSVFKDMILG